MQNNNLRRFFIIGYMGSGTTTIGRCLAQNTGLDFIDMDSVITSKQDMSVKQIFMKYGEHTFRNYEGELLDKIITEDMKNNIVVSCGNGIILDDANCKILSNETVVYLCCEPNIMYDRIQNKADLPNAYFQIKDEGERRRIFCEQYAKRKALYEQIADITVSTDTNTPDEIAAGIAKELDTI